MASDNKSLGRFILDGIPPAPRGMPQVEVTFDVDANGILQVKAKDKASGKEQSIRIEARSGLSDADIERMKKDAEIHGEEDRKKREEAEMRNQADQLIYSAEKALKDAGDKVSNEIKTDVETKIADLKKAKESNSGLKEALEALNTSMSKIGEAMYKQNQQTPPADTNTNSENKDNGENEGPIRDTEAK
jgi:molecular chaperone DnaK